jgi:tetratricopeptide (TPR) repeat protein
MALAQQKKLPAALAEFETALRLDPQNAAIFANRGVVYAEGGDLSAAQADFEQAIRMQPKAPELYVNRAHVRRRQDDLRGALEDLQKALSVAPSRWEERNRIEEEVQRLKSIATGSND